MMTMNMSRMDTPNAAKRISPFFNGCISNQHSSLLPAKPAWISQNPKRETALARPTEQREPHSPSSTKTFQPNAITQLGECSVTNSMALSGVDVAAWADGRVHLHKNPSRAMDRHEYLSLIRVNIFWCTTITQHDLP
jgi:hypothetical protein